MPASAAGAGIRMPAVTGMPHHAPVLIVEVEGEFQSRRQVAVPFTIPTRRRMN
jgi:hypothetical protein